MLGRVVYRRRYLVNAVHARKWAIVVAVSATAAIVAGTSAMASEGDTRVEANSLHEQLTGYSENPLALSTTGGGQFRAQIDEEAEEVSYELSYTGLEGAVTQAHIHFGSQSQVGGISVFLCSNLGNGPAGTQACPAAPATISGTIRPADVIGPAGQGIAAGQFAELIAAIRAGATYVNVHSTLYPVGEIRAQLGNGH
jgi:CHRD domain